MELGTVDRRLLDDDRLAWEPVGECGEDVAGLERLVRSRAAPGRAAAGTDSAVRRLALRNARGEFAADRRGRREHRELRWASVHLVRVVADDRDPRARLRQASRRVRRLAEDRRADDEQRVERRELLAQSRPVGRKDAAEEPMVLREAGTCSERLLEDGRPEPLGQADQRRPALGAVGARADHKRRRAGVCEEGNELVHRRRVGAGRPADLRGCGVLALLVGSGVPVVHGDDHDCRPTVGLRLVRSAEDRAGDVLGPARAGRPRPDTPRRGPLELPGEEGFQRQVPPVLLADEHDERGPIHAGGRESADGVPEPRGRVEEGEGGLLPCERPARGEADNGPFVQCKHEAEVLREGGEERDLGRAGVPEDRRQPALAEDVERRVTYRRHESASISQGGCSV